MFKLYITPLETFHTKYGKVKINRDGYYEISSKKENNKGKMWHRLIWEEYYGKLPKNTHIHHIDMDRKNNCILNLEPMVNSEHIRLHRIGKNRSEKECYAISKRQNTTGYFRVHKEKSKTSKQGFLYNYQYYDDGERKFIRRVNLKDLQEEVERRNLKWSKIEDLEV